MKSVSIHTLLWRYGYFPLFLIHGCHVISGWLHQNRRILDMLFWVSCPIPSAPQKCTENWHQTLNWKPSGHYNTSVTLRTVELVIHAPIVRTHFFFRCIDFISLPADYTIVVVSWTYCFESRLLSRWHQRNTQRIDIKLEYLQRQWHVANIWMAVIWFYGTCACRTGTWSGCGYLHFTMSTKHIWYTTWSHSCGRVCNWRVPWEAKSLQPWWLCSSVSPMALLLHPPRFWQCSQRLQRHSIRNVLWVSPASCLHWR